MPRSRDLEAELETLRKKAENRQCPSCAAEERVGFRNICVKFNYFLCSDCKAAHQAFSHRIKGINMSTFTEEELDRLHATSNADVAAVWLGKLSREEICRMCPRKTDKPEEWHKWIKRVFLNQEFYVEGGGAKKKKKSKKKTAASEAAEGATKRKSKSKAPVEVVPDATFDAFTSSAPAADDDLFGDSAFGDFSAAAPDPFAAAPSDPFASDGGGFGDFSAPAGGDPFNAAPAAKSNDAFATDDLFSALPASSSSAIPDPFGGSSAQQPGSDLDDLFGGSSTAAVGLHSTPAACSTTYIYTNRGMVRTMSAGQLGQPMQSNTSLNRSMSDGMMQPQRSSGGPVNPNAMMNVQAAMQQGGGMQQGMGGGMMRPQGGMQQGGMMQGGMMQPQGGMMQPQGGMMQPQGGMMQPQGGMMQPQGGMMRPQGMMQQQGGMMQPQGGMMQPQGGMMRPQGMMSPMSSPMGGMQQGMAGMQQGGGMQMGMGRGMGGGIGGGMGGGMGMGGGIGGGMGGYGTPASPFTSSNSANILSPKSSAMPSASATTAQAPAAQPSAFGSLWSNAK